MMATRIVLRLHMVSLFNNFIVPHHAHILVFEVVAMIDVDAGIIIEPHGSQCREQGYPNKFAS